MEVPVLLEQIEPILEKYVIPELKNSVGFLRARACWVFGRYGHIEFKNKDNIHKAVEGIYHCLLD
jgi:hypothetical protein